MSAGAGQGPRPQHPTAGQGGATERTGAAGGAPGPAAGSQGLPGATERLSPVALAQIHRLFSLEVASLGDLDPRLKGATWILDRIWELKQQREAVLHAANCGPSRGGFKVCYCEGSCCRTDGLSTCPGMKR